MAAAPAVAPAIAAEKCFGDNDSFSLCYYFSYCHCPADYDIYLAYLHNVQADSVVIYNYWCRAGCPVLADIVYPSCGTHSMLGKAIVTCDFLLTALQRISHITSLYLQQGYECSMLIELSERLCELPHLTTLGLERMPFSCSLLQTVLCTHRSLQTLHLKDCSISAGVVDPRAFPRFRLRHLSLSSMSVPPELIANLLTIESSITELDFRYINHNYTVFQHSYPDITIRPLRILHWAPGYPTSLFSGVTCLSAMLKHNPTLHTLGFQFSDADATLTQGLLKSLSPLCHLYLDLARDVRTANAFLQDAGHWLKSCPQLEGLTIIRGFNYNSSRQPSFIDAILGLTRLTLLSLDYLLAADDIEILCNGLIQGQQIQSLSLTWAPGRSFLPDLANLIRKCPSLTELKVKLPPRDNITCLEDAIIASPNILYFDCGHGSGVQGLLRERRYRLLNRQKIFVLDLCQRRTGHKITPRLPPELYELILNEFIMTK